MKLDLMYDGLPVGVLEVKPQALDLIKGTVRDAAVPGLPERADLDPNQFAISTPVASAQIYQLFKLIDPLSVALLKLFAKKGGVLTWGETRAIFDIQETHKWSAFGNHYNRHITRRFHEIVESPDARLIWWIDADPRWTSKNKDNARLFIDGPALEALRVAVEELEGL